MFHRQSAPASGQAGLKEEEESMKVGRRSIAVLLAVVLAATLTLIGGRATPAAHASTKAGKLLIWTDSYRKAAVDKVTSAWGSTRGVDVVVVVKDFGKIQDDLKNVAAGNAPDVIVGAHDWTGALAANGSPAFCARTFSLCRDGFTFSSPATMASRSTRRREKMWCDCARLIRREYWPSNFRRAMIWRSRWPGTLRERLAARRIWKSLMATTEMLMPGSP